jgi:N-acetylmuramoyl-L-alanine amidase
VPYQTDLADRLRKEGLKVKECDGWKNCGNNSNGNFHPKAFVIHHTAGAGPSAGKAPSLKTIIHGRSDLAGPLANIYMDYEGTVYTIAAGAANHAGTPDGGSWKGCYGNSDAFGFEIEHPGTSPLANERAELAARAVAAVIRGRFGTSMVAQHKEWAPSRKIDLATSPSAGWWRDRISHYLQHPGEGGFLMALSNKEQEQLADDAHAAAHFAGGIRRFYEALADKGGDADKVKKPDGLDKHQEAGWKLAKNTNEAAKR